MNGCFLALKPGFFLRELCCYHNTESLLLTMDTSYGNLNYSRKKNPEAARVPGRRGHYGIVPVGKHGFVT